MKRKNARPKHTGSGLCDGCKKGHYIVGPKHKMTNSPCTAPGTCTCIICGPTGQAAVLA